MSPVVGVAVLVTPTVAKATVSVDELGTAVSVGGDEVHPTATESNPTMIRHECFFTAHTSDQAADIA
jgi:hypothetical protein